MELCDFNPFNPMLCRRAASISPCFFWKKQISNRMRTLVCSGQREELETCEGKSYLLSHPSVIYTEACPPTSAPAITPLVLSIWSTGLVKPFQEDR